ncbi:hypothetical protein T5B8_11596 [Salinisphaera sp. T5B8]|uniref:hypothetical protein n=1 Tax=unclassified Salinisphaera TaxID=2649847 RepID=UPI0033409C55
MNSNDARALANKRLVNIHEYDSALVLNGVICLGLSIATLHAEPASGVLFGTIAVLSFAARHRLRRFAQRLTHDLASLADPDGHTALFARCRTSVWRIVTARG